MEAKAAVKTVDEAIPVLREPGNASLTIALANMLRGGSWSTNFWSVFTVQQPRASLLVFTLMLMLLVALVITVIVLAV